MIHPQTTIKLVNEHIGLGVFATDLIPAGTIVFAPDKLDRKINKYSRLLRDPQYAAIIDRYSFRDSDGDFILSWDHAKYINHHCNANTLCTAWGFDIAVRDIEKGEELSCDYGLLNIESDMFCSCDAPTCRGIVKDTDILNYAMLWDDRIKSALAISTTDKQPLLGILNYYMEQSFLNYLEYGTDYLSVIKLRYDETKLNPQ